MLFTTRKYATFRINKGIDLLEDDELEIDELQDNSNDRNVNMLFCFLHTLKSFVFWDPNSMSLGVLRAMICINILFGNIFVCLVRALMEWISMP